MKRKIKNDANSKPVSELTDEEIAELLEDGFPEWIRKHAGRCPEKEIISIEKRSDYPELSKTSLSNFPCVKVACAGHLQPDQEKYRCSRCRAVIRSVEEWRAKMLDLGGAQSRFNEILAQLST